MAWTRMALCVSAVCATVGLTLSACSPGSSGDPSTTASPSTTIRSETTLTTTLAATTTVLTTTTATTTTTTVPTFDVDLGESASSAMFREPDESLILPWGDRPGEAGHNHLIGIWALDVASDGAAAIVDAGNLRVQLWSGGEWSVLADFNDNEEFLPYGVAALDSGLILVHGLPRGSRGTATATGLLYARDGTLVDSGRVPVVTNSQWGGGEYGWSAFGPGAAPYYWVQLTDGDHVVDFDDELLEAIDQEPAGRIQSGEDILPHDPFRAAGYHDVRFDSGIGFHVEGGQGWNNANPLDPFVVTVTRGDAVERWNQSNWGDTIPMIWDVDDERLVTVTLYNPPGSDQEYHVLDCLPDGTCESFRIARDYWMESNSWDWARLEDGKLYVIETTVDAARIDIFELSG